MDNWKTVFSIYFNIDYIWCTYKGLLVYILKPKCAFANVGLIYIATPGPLLISIMTCLVGCIFIYHAMWISAMEKQ